MDDREEENYNDQVEIKSKYQNIFNDFYDNIKILKNLFGTQEFNKLKSFSENLNCKKKSGRENIALNLNNNINENYTNMVGVHFDSQKNGKANKSKSLCYTIMFTSNIKFELKFIFVVKNI